MYRLSWDRKDSSNTSSCTGSLTRPTRLPCVWATGSWW
ncbi:hypothetical protein EVA_06864 [gut metagenome]|uniref:Uncharacterized protein n=1 Tax=gut metagenome TaxID=749906 RepID=J9GWM8_9ZZZZ